MSKYKYSSLLSSQYRQVFKSYHSLDRTEQELKDNLAKSLHKRIHTQIHQFEGRNSDLHYQKSQFSVPNKKPQIYLYYKTQPKYACSGENFLERSDTDIYSTRLGNREKLSHKNTNIRHNSILSEQKLKHVWDQFADHTQCKEKTNYDCEPNQSKNYELKMKASIINKRRNDIKLKVRVNDIDKIRKKYEYLNENDGSTQVLQNQNGQKQDRKFKPIQHSPLLETNKNRISSIPIKSIKQGTRNLVRKANDEQNIQTPHFHQTQTKKQTIQPSLISLKLQNLVKNTFTDRY